MQEPTKSPGTGLEFRWSRCPEDHGPADTVLDTIEQNSGPGAVVTACRACALRRMTGAR